MYCGLHSTYTLNTIAKHIKKIEQHLCDNLIIVWQYRELKNVYTASLCLLIELNCLFIPNQIKVIVTKFVYEK